MTSPSLPQVDEGSVPDRPVSRTAAQMAAVMLLGRDWESTDALDWAASVPSIGQLRDLLIHSEEFRSNILKPLVTAPHWVATDILDGRVIWLDLHDLGVSRACLNGSWEPAETSWISERAGPDSTMLDIGANIGWFTLVAASRGATVHAFEADSNTARYLSRSVTMSAVDSIVTVHQIALSDKVGELVAIGREKVSRNRGHTWLLSNDEAADVSFQSSVALTRTLDSYDFDQVTLIKIDVEGAEGLVLRGADQTILKHRPSIICELYPSQLLAVSGWSPQDLATYFTDKNYRSRRLRIDGAIDEIDWSGEFPPDDILSVVFEPVDLTGTNSDKTS